MTQNLFIGSSNFKLVIDGLIALHRLIKIGKDDSSEADLIRDSLDAPLAALDPKEYEQAQQFSENLFLNISLDGKK